jgi:hypothetical protein
MQLPCSFTLYKKLLYKTYVLSKIYNHISLYDPVVMGTNVDPISQVCMPAMLVLLIVET